MNASTDPGRASGARPTDEGPWTVLRIILWSADYLEGKGIASARIDAEHLLAHALELDRLQLYLQFERPLSPEELDRFRPLLKRRAGREPLQYVVGVQPFRDLELRVGPGVLVPRPETEVLVDLVLEWCEGRPDPTALDVGAGSGAICLSLAREGYFTHIVATEVSEAALSLARRNRDEAELADRVDLRLGSLFEPVGASERFDVVVSNPPYVAEVDEATLEPEVRDWEPREALFAGPDGLDLIRRILPDAARHLKEGGLLALEVGAGQAETVAELARETGRYVDVRVRKDYSGRKRFVLAHGAG